MGLGLRVYMTLEAELGVGTGFAWAPRDLPLQGHMEGNQSKEPYKSNA